MAAAAALAHDESMLDFLMRRIRHNSDFPALSSTISEVNRVASSDREPLSALCNSILKDFALTNRLLKTVNAAYLSQYGGSIGTVSRATAILGLEGVRNLAMSLLLFEHLHGRANATALKDEAVATYFSGVLARNLSGRLGVADGEQACICAMFHRLGKMLATFYLHDEAQAVEQLMQSRGLDEARASREVLGVSYENLGSGVAKSWHFPAAIVASMAPVKERLTRRPAQEAEKLRALASLSNSLADTVRLESDKERKASLNRLVAQYGAATGVTEASLTETLRVSAEALAREAGGLGINATRSAFLATARGLGLPRSPDEPAQKTDLDVNTLVAEAKLPDADPTQLLAPAGPGTTGNRQAALATGVQDITHTLTGDFELNDVLRIILETMYRGIGFKRVLLFVLDPRNNALRCRFGFGGDADAIVQKGLSVPLDAARDLFHAAVGQGVDLCVEDIEAEKIRSYVPDWYRKALVARGLMLLPIQNKKRAVGLIYADSDSPAMLRFTAEELGLLKTLRNQAVLAMRQKS